MSSINMSAIELSGLTKRYGDIVANDDVTFDVESGEIFGYLGPNGAGKTTTIRLLLGLINPTDGTAQVLGADIRDRRALTSVKHDIGYLPDTLGFDEHLTGKEVLDYFARMRGDERREEMLRLFSPPLDRKVREYSAGNRRMLGIIQAFMHDPELVIMDEPTAGLDPLKQDRLHLFLQEECKNGKTIFFSSHILSEVQRIADRVGIIRNGKIVTLEGVEKLMKQGGKQVRVHFSDNVSEEEFLTEDMIETEISGKSIRFTYTGEVKSLLEHLVTYNVEDIEIADPQLDEIFKHYYGNNNHDSNPPE